MANYLYRQIKDWLIREIETNAKTEHYPLPSENQLMIRFRCSRIAVRRALSELEAEHRIYKIRGKGSFAKAQEDADALKQKIAVVLPACDTTFLAEIMQGITEVCREKKLIPVTYVAWNSPELEAEYLAQAQKDCKGILYMPEDGGYLTDAILNLRLKKAPLVFLDRRLAGFDDPVVSSDHYAIGYEAVRYLHARGHRHLVYLGFFPMLSTVTARQKGYEAALLDCFGKIERNNLVLDDFSQEDILPFWLKYFTQNPEITGIVAPSGYPGEVLVNVMRKLRKTLGEDYEIVFIDNSSDYTENILGIRCAEIVQDAREIGRRAVRLLSKIFDAPDRRPDSSLVPFSLRNTLEGKFRERLD